MATAQLAMSTPDRRAAEVGAAAVKSVTSLPDAWPCPNTCVLKLFCETFFPQHLTDMFSVACL